MDKKIIITEKNRDWAKIWLEQIDDTNEYTIHTDKDFVLQYARILYDRLPEDATEYDFLWNVDNINFKGIIKASCTAYDPSGGPFISVGSKINEKYYIKRIYRDDKLKFVIGENQ